MRFFIFSSMARQFALLSVIRSLAQSCIDLFWMITSTNGYTAPIFAPQNRAIAQEDKIMPRIVNRWRSACLIARPRFFIVGYPVGLNGPKKGSYRGRRETGDATDIGKGSQRDSFNELEGVHMARPRAMRSLPRTLVPAKLMSRQLISVLPHFSRVTRSGTGVAHRKICPIDVGLAIWKRIQREEKSVTNRNKNITA